MGSGRSYDDFLRFRFPLIAKQSGAQMVPEYVLNILFAQANCQLVDNPVHSHKLT